MSYSENNASSTVGAVTYGYVRAELLELQGRRTLERHNPSMEKQHIYIKLAGRQCWHCYGYSISLWRYLILCDSAGTGCSWAAERSWHAPLSHGLRRLRLRRRQGRWWMGCRPCLPSSFDRAAVICYRAAVASINFWHMHTCTFTTTDLPLLSFSPLHSDSKSREQREAKRSTYPDSRTSVEPITGEFLRSELVLLSQRSHTSTLTAVGVLLFDLFWTSWSNHRVEDSTHLRTARDILQHPGSADPAVVFFILLSKTLGVWKPDWEVNPIQCMQQCLPLVKVTMCHLL